MDHASNASVSSLEASGSQVGSPHNVPVQAQDVLGTEEIGRVCDIRDAMNENLSEIASPINLSGALDKQALHGGENESTLHRATIRDAHSSSASTSQGTKATRAFSTIHRTWRAYARSCSSARTRLFPTIAELAVSRELIL